MTRGGGAVYGTQPGWAANPVARCWDLHDERGRLAGQVGADTVSRHGHEAAFQAWATHRFGVPLPRGSARDDAALAWIREVLGDEIADLASGMPRESPMT